MKKTILVIDDSGAVLRNMKENLEKSYNVFLANSGELGIKYLSERTADIIILDIMMPVMDGFETYRHIRNTVNGKDVPVIFLTGSDDDENELIALEMGAADFAKKGSKPQILINRIERIIALDEYNKHVEKVIATQRNQLEQITLESIMAIASTIDAKDKYTKGHSDRVAEYACRIGERMGLDEKDLEQLHTLGLLHDIGKIGIPDSVLLKDTRLTDEEYAIMKSHTVVGGKILSSIKSIPNIAEGAKYHHERYDGHGYPDGIKGDEIPMAARIISVADAYDAMTSNRVYRAHLSDEVVYNEIVKGRGTQFDPEVADIMLELLDENSDFCIK